MITIVIPTKNEEDYLPTLLESIKRQTQLPSAVVVADAFSTDRTREIALSFGAKVVDGGLIPFGRNRGAQHADTPLILFLDADVEMTDPKFLEKTVSEMLERKLDLATCDVSPSGGNFVDTLMHKIYNSYVRAWGAIFPHAPGFCLFVRREKHKELGGFDESVTFCEDHDYARRLNKIGKFGFLNSKKISVSIRRLDRDGRLNIALKYILAELHIALIGPIRHNLFNYTFGHGSKKNH